MKNLNLKLAGVFAFSLLSASTFAQNWKQGGNGAIPAAWNVAIPANQLLGTTTNFPLRMITNNVQRMLINNGTTGGQQGYIGMGNTLPVNFVPLQRLHLFQSNNNQDILTRWSNGSLPYGPDDGLDIGLLATSDKAVIWNKLNTPIGFYTNDVERMRLWEDSPAS